MFLLCFQAEATEECTLNKQKSEDELMLFIIDTQDLRSVVFHFSSSSFYTLRLKAILFKVSLEYLIVIGQWQHHVISYVRLYYRLCLSLFNISLLMLFYINVIKIKTL